MPEDMSDRMPEDLPVRKCINVMVGIIRSEVIFVVKVYPLLCMIVATKNKLRESQCYWTLPAAELRVNPRIRVSRLCRLKQHQWLRMRCLAVGGLLLREKP